MISFKMSRPYMLILRLGVLTGTVFVLSEIVNLFVLYRQLRFDYYLSMVAVAFLLAGIWIGKERRNKRAASPAAATESIIEIAPVMTPGVPVVQPVIHSLTTKELEVLALIASGKANKEIAGLLYVEMSTVKTHINNIYSKLSVSNRRDAKAKYAEITRIAS